MEAPKYNEMYKAFLESLSDGKRHGRKEVRELVAEKMQG